MDLKKYPFQGRCAHCGTESFLDLSDIVLHMIRKHPLLMRGFVVDRLIKKWPKNTNKSFSL